MNEFLTFAISGRSASGKTRIWSVYNRYDGTGLGDVKWYAPWRKYAFYPNPQAELVFESKCLRDLAEFCETKTAEHRRSKNERSEPAED